MVQLLRREPVTEYELRDRTGRAIGSVVQPVGTPRTGPGAETVLLIRDPRARLAPAGASAGRIGLKRFGLRPGSAGTIFPSPSHPGGRSCVVPGSSRS